jgi:hypothetical protein
MIGMMRSRLSPGAGYGGHDYKMNRLSIGAKRMRGRDSGLYSAN